MSSQSVSAQGLVVVVVVVVVFVDKGVVVASLASVEVCDVERVVVAVVVGVAVGVDERVLVPVEAGVDAFVIVCEVERGGRRRRHRGGWCASPAGGSSGILGCGQPCCCPLCCRRLGAWCNREDDRDVAIRVRRSPHRRGRGGVAAEGAPRVMLRVCVRARWCRQRARPRALCSPLS